MANALLLSRLGGIRSAILAQRAGGNGLPNSMIGSERETFLREFLQKVFPSHYRFSSGAITDSNGNISGQIDIAVEHPFLPSFPMPGSSDRLLLAESVAAVVEVKSDLSGQWNQVESTTRMIRVLRRKWLGSTGISGNIIESSAPGESRIPLIAVGYTGHSTLEGLSQRLASTNEENRPDAAFVVESGCFVGCGIQACGDPGLFALCVVLNRLMTNAIAAECNPSAYMD